MQTSWLAVVGEAEGGPSLRTVAEPGCTAPPIAETADLALLFSGALAPDARSGPPGSDAETVLSAYARDGPSAFPRLRGRFALVLLDRRAGACYALRDPLGAHPLFYAEDAGTLYLSPSAERVARRNGKQPELNRLAAAAFILRTSLDGEETLFDGVRRLLQTHVLERRASRLESTRYWFPQAGGDVQDVSGELHRLLRRAVERVVDGRAGVFLSGGLDSALVAAVLADVSQSRGLPPPVALSIAFPGTDADEEAMQRTVASRLGLEHVVRTPADLIGPGRLLEAALELGRRPTAQPPELLTPVYDALAALGADRGCTTILGGSGGDEWLMPPPGYAADRVRALDLRALAELCRAWHAYWPEVSPLDAVRGVVWRSGVRSVARSAAISAAERFAPALPARIRRTRAEGRVPAWLAPDQALRQGPVGSMLVRANSAVDVEKQALLESANLSVAHELGFEAKQRAGIAFGSPLLDPDVVAFLYLLSPRRLIQGGRAKALARDVLSRYLGQLPDSWPRTVYANSLWADAIRSEGSQAWASSQGAPALTEVGLVEPGRLEATLTGAVTDVALPELAAAWRAVSLDSWFRCLSDRRHGL